MWFENFFRKKENTKESIFYGINEDDEFFLEKMEEIEKVMQEAGRIMEELFDEKKE